ncbi:MAG: FkbM family methyltransferase [Acidobacteria bacterium]|nr:FkbM family methyltransferase [Acidobacteriota bacterium]
MKKSAQNPAKRRAPRRPASNEPTFESSVALLHENTPLYFLHMLGAAGTALERFLEAKYFAGDVFPGKTWDEYFALRAEHPETAARAYAFYRGHFGCNLRYAVQRKFRYVTMLQHPVERALSYYKQVLQNPAHYFHAKACRTGGFSTYFEDPETRRTVVNAQLRAWAFDLDPLATYDTWDKKGTLIEQYFDTVPMDLAEADLLKRGISRLEQCCFVCTTESLNESIPLLSELFNWPVTGHPLPNDVISHGTEDLDAGLIRKLASANEAEVEFYESARRIQASLEKRTRLSRPYYGAFVSYASNQEDVLLHRALGNLPRGFYIDAGAQHPTDDSVTKAFYDRGWRGINIEPVPEYFADLQLHRPEDMNLECAVGASPGTTRIHAFEHTGLSTTSKEYAKRHRALGFRSRTIERTLDTLSAICERYVSSDIHFLKIDVEGAEQDVLRGLDLKKYRPWIILLEATVPNSTELAHFEWEHLLLERNYSFVFFDGLNRYYIADEHRELCRHFERPVSVFDRFIKRGEAESRELARRERLERELAERQLQCLLLTFERERNETSEQIDALDQWAKSADSHAKSLLAEVQCLQSTREREQDEAERRIAELTHWATSAETHAKSLQQELQNQQQDRERERLAVQTQLADFEKSSESMGTYIQSLLAALETASAEALRNQVEYAELEAARKIENANALKQIEELTKWATSADEHARSLVAELERVRAEMEARSSEVGRLNTELHSFRKQLEELHRDSPKQIRLKDQHVLEISAQLEGTRQAGFALHDELESVKAELESNQSEAHTTGVNLTESLRQAEETAQRRWETISRLTAALSLAEERLGRAVNEMSAATEQHSAKERESRRELKRLAEQLKFSETTRLSVQRLLKESIETREQERQEAEKETARLLKILEANSAEIEKSRARFSESEIDHAAALACAEKRIRETRLWARDAIAGAREAEERFRVRLLSLEEQRRQLQEYLLESEAQGSQLRAVAGMSSLAIEQVLAEWDAERQSGGLSRILFKAMNRRFKTQ